MLKCFLPTRRRVFPGLSRESSRGAMTDAALHAALRESEGRYRMLHETLRDAFVRVAMDGRIVECNDAYCQMLGYSAEEVLALTYLQLTPERWHDTEAAIVRDQILVRGYSDVYEKEYSRKDGTTIPVELRTILARDETGRPVAMWAIVRETSERRKVEEALRAANEQLSEADRQKNEFIAVLSHELRNPLAPIRYAVPLLQQEPLSEAGRRALQVIDRQVDHLTRLVDDLLDVGRIASGKIELRRGYVTVATIVKMAVERSAPAMAAGQHSLQVSLPEEPIWICGDEARLSQVVTNLLDNSAKYTPRGGEIGLSAVLEGHDAVIRVRDNGCGIAPEALARVFGMFSQAHRSQVAPGGLGIGLALVRRLVELHGGTVEAASAGVDRGAEFTIRLPVTSEAGAQPPIPVSAATARRALRVLVVDDNRDLVEMLSLMVESFGHDVRRAFDGPSAVSAASIYRPDIVLLDLGLPGFTGLEVARELRRRETTSGAYLVALTGWGQADHRRETLEAGFNAHLTKPADPAILERLLAAVATGFSST